MDDRNRGAGATFPLVGAIAVDNARDCEADRSHAEPLNIELEGLLISHPDILARQKSAAAAEEGVSVAYSGYLPKLDIYGETGPQYIDSPVLQSQGGGTWLSVSEVAGARITQNVFDGFATPAQVRSARLNLEAAEFTLKGVRQNVLFDGINAYVEVLRQNRLLTLARDSERTIMRQLNLEDERVQRGSGIAVDVLQAKSRLQLAKERRVGFEGALADATSRYIQVFAHAPQIATMTEPVPPLELLPADLENAVRDRATGEPGDRFQSGDRGGGGRAQAACPLGVLSESGCCG